MPTMNPDGWDIATNSVSHRVKLNLLISAEHTSYIRCGCKLQTMPTSANLLILFHIAFALLPTSYLLGYGSTSVADGCGAKYLRIQIGTKNCSSSISYTLLVEPIPWFYK